MLVWLMYWLAQYVAFQVFHYLTLRAVLVALTALVIMLNFWWPDNSPLATATSGSGRAR